LRQVFGVVSSKGLKVSGVLSNSDLRIMTISMLVARNGVNVKRQGNMMRMHEKGTKIIPASILILEFIRQNSNSYQRVIWIKRVSRTKPHRYTSWRLLSSRKSRKLLPSSGSIYIRISNRTSQMIHLHDDFILLQSLNTALSIQLTAFTHDFLHARTSLLIPSGSRWAGRL
jgi:hypothetical protein